MDDDLRKIQSWAMHGTVRQVYADMAARLTTEGDYEAELEADGETIGFYRVTKQGGFLGIGGKMVREPVLTVIRQGEEVLIPEEPRDEEFVHLLAQKLEAH